MKQDKYKGAMKYTPTFSIADEKAFKAGLNSYNKEIRKLQMKMRTIRLMGNQK